MEVEDEGVKVWVRVRVTEHHHDKDPTVTSAHRDSLLKMKIK